MDFLILTPHSVLCPISAKQAVRSQTNKNSPDLRIGQRFPHRNRVNYHPLCQDPRLCLGVSLDSSTLGIRLSRVIVILLSPLSFLLSLSFGVYLFSFESFDDPHPSQKWNLVSLNLPWLPVRALETRLKQTLNPLKPPRGRTLTLR